MHRIRKITLIWHRWVGLLMTAFLVVVGATGSMLAFYSELDHWMNPGLQGFSGQGLSAGALATQAQRLYPDVIVESVWLGTDGEAATVGVSAKPDQVGNTTSLAFDQVLLNPLTGAEIQRRRWGQLNQSAHSFMPFIYRLHYSLALDEWGGYTLGVVALIWTLDCFFSIVLTLPLPHRNKTPFENLTTGWKRWKTSWLIHFRKGGFRLQLDLHRALSLWLWILLFVFAWSSVAFNLNQLVYRPVTAALFGLSPEPPELTQPLAMPKLDWESAYSHAQQLMQTQAKMHGFVTLRDQSLYLDRARGIYQFTVLSSLDIGKYGFTQIAFNANSGELVSAAIPGHQPTGEVITQWLVWLHTAAIFGLAMQILVCLTGLVIVVVCITGVYVWWKKLAARRKLFHKK